MSKLIPFLFAGAGATVTSVGGVWMLKQQEKPKNQPKTIEIKFFDSLEAFKKEKDSFCVKELFTEVDLNSLTGSQTIASNKPSSTPSYLGTAPTSSSENTKGCLIIDWKKDEYGDAKKGKGTFTGTWAFKNDDKAFINFNVAKTNDSAQQLDLKGGFYLLEKSKSGSNVGKGEVKYHKEETTSSKQVEASKVGDHFPKAKQNALAAVENKSYWGFADETNPLNNICNSADDCKEESKKSSSRNAGIFIGNHNSEKKMKEWCEKLDGWENLYGKENFDLGKQLENFKGEGSLKHSVTQ